MLKQLSIVALVITVLPTTADAQQRPPLDPYGRPYVGANDWRPGPGDAQMGQPPMPAQGAPMMNDRSPSQAMAPSDNQSSFKDEYGNMYNSRGDRVDRSGRILPPPVTPPGAPALR